MLSVPETVESLVSCRDRTTIVFKIIYVVCTFLGTLTSLGLIIDFSDLMLLGMAFPNLIGCYILSNEVAKDLKDYWQRLSSGEMQAYAQVGLLQKSFPIRHRGIQLSIDDFGTGYSSLRYLSQFSVQTLKIDRSFVTQMEHNQRGIVQAIIDLAHNLQMTCIAEGVETDWQLNQLLQLGCEAAQGYLFARPLPLESATEYLQTHGFKLAG